ncbi:MAG: Gfo/Idh/MocA family oxidoreductase [bacterium]|nr:Gfo/Idh/MocA family oxidoreductase [bacterium]
MSDDSLPDAMNFAVVGCGMLAQQQHIPNIAASAKTVLHTCCDLSGDALSECRERFGALNTTNDYRAAINNPEVEAVVLATTEQLRLPVIEACAEAGKPIYVEKPLAGTLGEAYDIARVVAEAGIPTCVGHNRRCAPAMVDAHRIFRAHMEHPEPCPWRFEREGDARPALPDDGAAAMSVRINDDWYSWKGWVFDESQAQFGPMLFEMTHFTDLCNWFLAAPPVEVTALSGGTLNHGVAIRYEGGAIATILMTGNGTFGYPKELYEAMGNGGCVAVDHMLEVRTAGIEGASPRTCYPMLKDRHPSVGTEGGAPGWLAKRRAASTEAVDADDPMLAFTAEPDKGHAHAIDRFVDEIRGSGPVVCGVSDALLATRVSFAAIRSADEKRTVSMEEV